MKLEYIDESLRKEYIKQAHVWKESDIAQKDIMAGPQNEIAVAPNSEVTCQYVEWPADHKPSGASPKFLCKLQNGSVVRVKYGKENREVFSEVAASRLLWALGFYVDDVYPVRIRCLNCPEKDPFKPEEGERRIERLIEPALMEREFPGFQIEATKDQGWTWVELDEVDPDDGGAPKTQIEALKLLAVFIQHSDNKAQQQRLACYKEDLRDPDGNGTASCIMPVLMIQDLGATFGAGNQTSSDSAKMNFEGWSETDVWNEPQEHAYIVENRKRTCFGKLTNSLAAADGLNNPEILESGRQFLAKLLNQLSRDQIRDIFRVARVDQMDQYIEEGGLRRRVTVEDWTSAFIRKRQQILEHECPIVRGGEPLNQ